MKWLFVTIFSLGWLAVATADENELVTRTFAVPESFLIDYGVSDKSVIETVDPDWAQRILESAGVVFQGEAKATYQRERSKLVVRNVPSQLGLVEAFIAKLKAKGSRMVRLTVFEVLSNNDAFGAEPDLRAYKYLKPTVFEGQAPQRAFIAGVFGDEQFQVLIEALKRKDGVTVFDRASVVCRSKQPASFDIEGERLGIHPIVGADHITVGLAIQLAPKDYEITSPDWKRGAHRLEVSDRQVVAYSIRDKSGKMRTFFISNKLIDPSGQPLNKGK